MMRPVIVIGSGGHARVVLDGLLSQGRRVMFMTEIDESRIGQECMGIYIAGPDEIILEHDPDSVELINGTGSVAIPANRKKIWDIWINHGYTFATVVHPKAHVSPTATLAAGVQIMAGAVVQTGSTIGCNSIVNTNASVDHDCVIGEHCHIAPGAVLSGMVELGDKTHIGTGAAVIQGLKIGSQCVVGAGSTVIRDLSENQLAVGSPAKSIRSTA